MRRLRTAIIVFSTLGLMAANLTLPAQAQGNGEFDQALERFRQTRRQVQERAAQRTPDSRPDLFPLRQTQLLQAIDVLQARLHRLTGQVTRHQTRYGTYAEAITAELSSLSASLAELKAQTQAAATLQDLRRIAAQIHQLRQANGEQQARRMAILAQLEQFKSGPLAKARHRLELMAVKIHDLKASGKDVTALEPLLDQAQTELAQIRSQLQALKDQLGSTQGTVLDSPQLKAELTQLRDSLKHEQQLLIDLARQGKILTTSK